MAKKVKTKKKTNNSKMNLLDEYVYAFKTCTDGKLPHEKFKNLSSIIFYYDMYYKREQKLTIKQYLLQKVLPYAEVKGRKSMASEILSVVESTDEEILERATKIKFNY